MKTQQIIKRLNTDNAMSHNHALKYIDNTMKTDILTKLRIPIFIDKEEIWNQGLIAFWRSIYIRGVAFDYSKKDAIQRFLYTVCKRQVLKSVEQYTRRRTECLEDKAWAIIAIDTNMENLPMQTELLNDVQTLLSRHINETEWQVLSYKFLNMMSYDEIADTMDKSPGYLKNAKYRAVNKIKKALQQDTKLQAYLQLLQDKRNAEA